MTENTEEIVDVTESLRDGLRVIHAFCARIIGYVTEGEDDFFQVQHATEVLFDGARTSFATFDAPFCESYAVLIRKGAVDVIAEPSEAMYRDFIMWLSDANKERTVH